MECLKKLLCKTSSKDCLQIQRPDSQRNLNTSVKPNDFDEKIIYDRGFQKLFRIFLIFSANYEDSITDSTLNSTGDNVLKQNGKLLIFIRNDSADFLINEMLKLNIQINKHNNQNINSKKFNHFQVI